MVFAFAAPVAEEPEPPVKPVNIFMTVEGGNGGSASVGNGDRGGDKSLQFLDNASGHFGGSFVSSAKFIEQFVK